MVLSNDGNQDAYPKLELELVTQRTSGLPYRRYVTVVSHFDAPVVAYPVELTNGGLDTATEIAAGRMQADGDDITVFINNVESDRFLSGINTASTKIWGNLDLGAETTFTLDGALDNVTLYTELSITPVFKTVSNKKIYILQDLPTSGILRIDSEEFTYTGIDVKSGTFTACIS